MTDLKDNETYVWYLSYGSNMKPSVLSERRMVYPVESCPCRVAGWYLNFDVEGVPYFEPCFASIGQKPWKGSADAQMELQAVAHRITQEDFVRIQRTEGGGGHAGMGYESVNISAVSYDGKTLDTITLIHRSRVPSFFAHPSKRYHGLLVDGAKQSGLSTEYISYLEGIPAYERPNSAIQNILLILCLSPYVLFIAGPVLAWYFISSKLTFGGQWQGPKILYMALQAITDMCYVLHNMIWKHVCGSGYIAHGIGTTKKAS